MSTTSKLFFVLIVALTLAVVPALASTSVDTDVAEGVIIGNGNHQEVYNEDNTYVKHQDVKIDEDIDAHSTTIVTYEAPVDLSPRINYLGIGDASETRMIMEDEALVFAVSENQSYEIRSANPVAVYLIRRYQNDYLLIDSVESKLSYNKIYHKFEHGVVSPAWIFPQFTTKCHVNVGADEYLVIDNRYYAGDSMTEIQPTPQI